MARECTVSLVPDITVLGHFGPLAWLARRILASSCSGVSRVSMIEVRFREKVRVRTDAMRGGDALIPNYFGEDLF